MVDILTFLDNKIIHKDTYYKRGCLTKQLVDLMIGLSVWITTCNRTFQVSSGSKVVCWRVNVLSLRSIRSDTFTFKTELPFLSEGLALRPIGRLSKYLAGGLVGRNIRSMRSFQQHQCGYIGLPQLKSMFRQQRHFAWRAGPASKRSSVIFSLICQTYDLGDKFLDQL